MPDITPQTNTNPSLPTWLKKATAALASDFDEITNFFSVQTVGAELILSLFNAESHVLGIRYGNVLISLIGDNAIYY